MIHFTFGKYKDRLIDEVADEDPEYVIWAYEEVTNPKHGGVDKKLYTALRMDEGEESEFYLGVDMWGN